MKENKYLKKQEIVDYPGKKLPVVFLIDTSSSMERCGPGRPTGETVYKDGQTWDIVEDGGPTIMDSLLQRVQDFHNAMVQDRKASITCQTAYVTFSDKTNVIEDFGLVKSKQAPTGKIHVDGDETYIVSGLETALNLLDEQKKLIQDEGGDYFQPWLIILTDGEAHDDPSSIKQIKNELQRRQRAKKLTVYTVALSDDQGLYENIRGYSINKPIPYDKRGEELAKFFSFLKKSISSISNSKIKGGIPGYTDPDDLSGLQ